MKSCLSLLFVVLMLVAVVGGGAFLTYLSFTTEFSRKGDSSAARPPAPAGSAVPAGPGAPAGP